MKMLNMTICDNMIYRVEFHPLFSFLLFPLFYEHRLQGQPKVDVHKPAAWSLQGHDGVEKDDMPALAALSRVYCSM